MANHWSALQFPPATAEVIRERLDVMHEQELERGIEVMCERVKRVLCAQNFFEQLLTACRCGLVLLAEGGSSYSSELSTQSCRSLG